MKSSRPILLLEDDKVDTMTIKRALAELNVTNPTITCRNGEEALEYLRSPASGSPCVVLVDLDMPRMNGIECLRAVRTEGLLQTSPVVILSTSKEDQDKIECFKLNVAGYMIKPVDYSHFIEVIRVIDQY